MNYSNTIYFQVAAIWATLKKKSCNIILSLNTMSTPTHQPRFYSVREEVMTGIVNTVN